MKIDFQENLRFIDEPSAADALSARRPADRADPIGRAAYRTALGAMYEGDAARLMQRLPVASVNLVFTSPPMTEASC